MQALWSSVKDFAGQLGYSHVLAVDAAKLSGGARGAVIYSDAPKQMLEALDGEMNFAQHPVVQRALNTDIPFFVSGMRKQAEDAGQRWTQFLADVVRRGEGLVVPVCRGTELIAGFNFGGLTPDTSANVRSMLQVAAHAVIQKRQTLERGDRHGVVERVVQPAQVRGPRGDRQACLDQAQIMARPGAEHHPVFSQPDGLTVAIDGGMTDREDGHQELIAELHLEHVDAEGRIFSTAQAQLPDGCAAIVQLLEVASHAVSVPARNTRRKCRR